jgi:hypothetical protein
MKKYPLRFLAALLLASFGLTACDTPGQGAKNGAIAGGIIGGLATGRLRGALAGAAIGAGTGALIGEENKQDRERYYGQSDGDYPSGRPTAYPGYVISPYRPHNMIDVRGIPSDARVVDPSCNRIFINP